MSGWWRTATVVDLVNPSQDLIHFVAKAFAFLMVLVLMGFTESLKWREGTK